MYMHTYIHTYICTHIINSLLSEGEPLRVLLEKVLAHKCSRARFRACQNSHKISCLFNYTTCVVLSCSPTRHDYTGESWEFVPADCRRFRRCSVARVPVSGLVRGNRCDTTHSNVWRKNQHSSCLSLFSSSSFPFFFLFFSFFVCVISRYVRN